MDGAATKDALGHELRPLGDADEAIDRTLGDLAFHAAEQLDLRLVEDTHAAPFPDRVMETGDAPAPISTYPGADGLGLDLDRLAVGSRPRLGGELIPQRASLSAGRIDRQVSGDDLVAKQRPACPGIVVVEHRRVAPASGRRRRPCPSRRDAPRHVVWDRSRAEIWRDRGRTGTVPSRWHGMANSDRESVRRSGPPPASFGQKDGKRNFESACAKDAHRQTSFQCGDCGWVCR
jgi:hypothetical protein